MLKRTHPSENEASSEPKRPRITETNTEKKAPSHRLTRAPYHSSPWTASDIPSTYPPLPYISDPMLRSAVFTHKGAKKSEKDKDYERLEWLGDADIELIATLLIDATFPDLPAGRCSHIRETLVKNETLAIYARHYKFEKSMDVPPEIFGEFGPLLGDKARRDKERRRTKILGDSFEAYVAGVIEADPENGMKTACAWLKALWSITIEDKIREEDQARAKKQAGTLKIDTNTIPPVDRLQRLIGFRGVDITYEDAPEEKDHNNGFTIYVKECYYQSITIPRLFLGCGRDIKKAKAKMKAAENAFENHSLINELADVKEKEMTEWERLHAKKS